MSFAGSNVSDVLKELSRVLAETTPRGRAPVVCQLGTEADAETTTADRIIFLPRSGAFNEPEVQPRGGRARSQDDISFDAYVTGHDFEAANALSHRLVNAIHNAFSHHGARVNGQGPGQVIDGGAASAASRFTRVVRVTFCVPVYAEKFTTGKGGAPAGTGTLVNSLGESPEEIDP